MGEVTIQIVDQNNLISNFNLDLLSESFIVGMDMWRLSSEIVCLLWCQFHPIQIPHILTKFETVSVKAFVR